MSFVSSRSDLCSAVVIAVLCVISWYIRPRNNGTRLYCYCYNVILFRIIYGLPWITIFWSRVGWFANDFHEWHSQHSAVTSHERETLALWRHLGQLFLYDKNDLLVNITRESLLIPYSLCIMSLLTQGTIEECCQKQILRAGTSNYIPQCPWDVITCPRHWHLLLATLLNW